MVGDEAVDVAAGMAQGPATWVGAIIAIECPARRANAVGMAMAVGSLAEIVSHMRMIPETVTHVWESRWRSDANTLTNSTNAPSSNPHTA